MKYPELKDQMKDEMGRFRTTSLFFENCAPGREKYPAVYTLTDQEGKHGLHSAKKIYMEAEDPTEYQAAMDLVGNWKHWQRLCATKWFKAVVNEWREELEIKLRSKAVKQVIKLAKEDGKDTRMAAKWVATKSWKDKSTRGRPSKEEVERQVKIDARIDAETEDDYLRIVNGGKETK